MSDEKPASGPTDEQRMATIARLMQESRLLAEKLDHKLAGIVRNASKIGVDKIGGLGGLRMNVELTSLRETLERLKGMFP